MRMETMQAGYETGDKPLLHVCAYVSFQELATRLSHRNTGRYTQDPLAEKLLARVSTDENLHMVFYRNIMKAALEIAPDAAMRAIADEVLDFAMPGAVIPSFVRKAALIAKAGIYDLRIHHDDVVMPLLRYWKVFDLTGLGEVGETAREELAQFLKTLDGQASRFEERRDAAAARAAARR
jgi:acyl-[acyl-carrier-protein] desaturase